LRRLGSIVFTLAGIACAKHEGVTGPAAVFEADYARLAKAQCDGYRRCIPWYIDSLYSDDARCPADVSVRYHRSHPAIDDQINANAVAYDRGKLDGCMALFTGSSCDGFLARVTAAQGPCGLLAVGLRGEGSGCFDSFECSPGLYCAREPGACGRCTRPAAIGEICGERLCVPNGECPSTATSSGAGPVCVNKIDAGGSCDPSGVHRPGCVQPLICAGHTTVGTCTTKGRAGDPCDDPHFAPCDDSLGLFCVAGKCTPLTFVGLGASCGGLVACRGGFVCSPVTNSCALSPQPGDMCGSDASCAEGAFCDLSLRYPLCRTLLAEDSHCITTAQCAPPYGCVKEGGGVDGFCERRVYQPCP
jgi:Dickkopf-like protein